MPVPAVHRVTTPGQPGFQLRQGEEGLSVFDSAKVGPEEILPAFREGSEVATRTIGQVEEIGLTVKATPGDASLPINLQNAHMEIGPGADMTRKQFKKKLKELEPTDE